MPKKITSHKNLSIRWRTDANCFQLDLRTIGGKRENFDTKVEASQHAKEMFEIFESGKLATKIKPWTVEKGIAQYLEHSKRRSEDPDSDYSPSSLTNQRCHLNNCTTSLLLTVWHWPRRTWPTLMSILLNRTSSPP